MKVDVNYLVVFEAMEKNKNRERLNEMETETILTVLKAIQGDYIPTEMEYANQATNVRLLDKLDYEKQTDLWEKTMDKCRVFENKYC